MLVVEEDMVEEDVKLEYVEVDESPRLCYVLREGWFK